MDKENQSRLSNGLDGKPERMEQLKEDGNKAYVRGDVAAAIKYYRQGLGVAEEY